MQCASHPQPGPCSRILGLSALACLAAAFPALAAPPIAVDEGAPLLLVQAYSAAVSGECAQAAGLLSNAVHSYRDAVRSLESLQAQYPGWQTDMLRFRLIACRNQLKALESGAAADPVSEQRLTQLLRELQSTLALLSLTAQTPPASKTGAQDELGRRLRQAEEERDQTLRTCLSLRNEKKALETRLASAESRGAASAGVFLTPSVLKSEARRLVRAKEIGTALTLLAEARALLPDDDELGILLAVTLCQAGKYDPAIPILEELTRRNPTNATAFVALGTAHMGKGGAGPARIATETALALNGSLAEAHFNLAQIVMSILPPNAALAQKHYRLALEFGAQPDTNLENLIRQGLLYHQLEIHRADKAKEKAKGKSRFSRTVEEDERGKIPNPAP